MPDALENEYDIAEPQLLEEEQGPTPEELAAKQWNYIEDWIARQPNDSLRQQFADGLLSDRDAENLIANEALDPLLGPPYKGHICDVCSRDRFLYDPNQGCDEWDTPHLPPHLTPAWDALQARLPEGTEWSFYEVFPCVEKRIGPHERVNKLVYIAKLTVPVGPFRFQRTILLGQVQ